MDGVSRGKSKNNEFALPARDWSNYPQQTTG